MKLLSVKLNRNVRIQGQAYADIDTSVAPNMRYIANPPSVSLGDELESVPWHCVIGYRAIHDEPLVCEDCKEEFVNAQGLGNHKRLKHKGAA